MEIPTQTDRGSSRYVTPRCLGGIDSDRPAPIVREDTIRLALASVSQIEASPSQINVAVSKTRTSTGHQSLLADTPVVDPSPNAN